MKILVDVNLSPAWVDVLTAKNHEAVHWTAVGDPRAPDADVLTYARERGYTLLTHDLDFGVLLALAHSVGPSVLQVRTQNVLPETIGDVVIQTIETHQRSLDAGALITVDEASARVRMLPIK